MYLKDIINRSLTDCELEEKVSAFVLPNGVWNREILHSLLPNDICSNILRCNLSGIENVEDTIVWNYPKECEFSVKSAYSEISKCDQVNVEKNWELIWKWPGKQRNRTFMWLCPSNKILTNIQRKKKKFTSDAECPICRMEEE